MDEAGADPRSAQDGATVVLTGVDGSPTSLRGAAFAVGMARRLGARLVAVHVSAGIPLAGVAAMAPGGVDAVAAARQALASEVCGQVRESAASIGVTVEFLIASGDPFTELTRAATKIRADMIVVGASESAGHRLVGSLAVRLVRAGRWPVTVVP